MSKNHISVALCTCNGAPFLQALLESLAAQTLPPTELVACDDASGDQTRHILEVFAQHASFPVRFYENPMALGVVKNFERAIGLCSGQAIALADQDDVWRPDKLEKLALALSPHSALAAFSDAEVVDNSLNPLGYRMWQRVAFTLGEQARMQRQDGCAVLLKHHIVTGATLAFKAQLREIALPIPERWPHDAWIAILAAAQDGLVAIPEPLIAYRQHENNVVGGLRRSRWQEARNALSIDRTAWYQTELELWRTLEARIESLPSSTPNALRCLTEKITHLEARASLPPERWRRLPDVIRQITAGSYKRYARNWGSIAIDLLIR